ncbi:hypothetical protein J7438_05035 [Thalassotalea sp. G20_0]|uniref:hypothetical protein n=1 Tax=Thalassotalea sp. G20_0 TaxID=2821093 RepID=UPI001ADB0BBC|nr:hypothetical protein [Thalassotalea sp. G20_0]MBO9493451.1 hypothetical protein [Thalassotalea sp. G20_0]
MSALSGHRARNTRAHKIPGNAADGSTSVEAKAPDKPVVNIRARDIRLCLPYQRNADDQKFHPGY